MLNMSLEVAQAGLLSFNYTDAHTDAHHYFPELRAVFHVLFSRRLEVPTIDTPIIPLIPSQSSGQSRTYECIPTLLSMSAAMIYPVYMATLSTFSRIARILPARSEASFEVMLTETTGRETPVARPRASLEGT
jgi:hypothetical protein